jgi:hypothetical protein
MSGMGKRTLLVYVLFPGDLHGIMPYWISLSTT